MPIFFGQRESKGWWFLESLLSADKSDLTDLDFLWIGYDFYEFVSLGVFGVGSHFFSYSPYAFAIDFPFLLPRRFISSLFSLSSLCLFLGDEPLTWPLFVCSFYFFCFRLNELDFSIVTFSLALINSSHPHYFLLFFFFLFIRLLTSL